MILESTSLNSDQMWQHPPQSLLITAERDKCLGAVVLSTWDAIIIPFLSLSLACGMYVPADTKECVSPLPYTLDPLLGFS